VKGQIYGERMNVYLYFIGLESANQMKLSRFAVINRLYSTVNLYFSMNSMYFIVLCFSVLGKRTNFKL